VRSPGRRDGAAASLLGLGIVAGLSWALRRRRRR
jgi:LPXTG-motif cell wall-anchored protein